MLKYLLLFLPFLLKGQDSSERYFSSTEKQVLKYVYHHAVRHGWYIRNMGIFRIEERALYKGDLLWKIDMIYDESDYKTRPPKQWSYVGVIPVLLFSDASGKIEGGIPADTLKRVIADRLYALPDTGPVPLPADEDGFRSSATAPDSPARLRPDKLPAFRVQDAPMVVIFNEKGEIVYSNFMPKSE